ncbi:MAG: menaquinone biosynthesis decarboxylase [Candidatus Cloacimonetes bacterium]|nr:menaquinone biosynthesis decarboxylase [Candidatus Cloacimonadota bacterium]
MKRCFSDLQEYLKFLDREGELITVDKEISPYLEISEVYQRHAGSKDGGKALLFTNVTGSSMPVAINVFGSYRRLELAFGTKDFSEHAQEIKELTSLKMPDSLIGKLGKAWEMRSVLSYPPRPFKGSVAPCQEVVLTGDQVDLSIMPVMTSWPQDGGPFITLPLVISKSLDGSQKNMGMYRMQIYDRNTTGMHWQIHKDGSHFHGQYRRAKKRMEVAVVIGADPSLVYSATAPLPPMIYELIFAGFVRGESVKTVKCKTVDLEVPAHAEIILEGYVEPDELRPEGPFGDHTGYYTPQEPYPVFHVTAITHRKNPVYLSTVVGKSPMEDCYLAYVTERLFLPLLQMIAPEVVDQHLPWDGNFHNCQVFTIKKEYPYQGRRLMSHIWGFTQASFCKCLITASEDAPIHDDEKFLEYFLDHLDISRNVFITEGIVDALDHSAPQPLYGGKIGFDISHPIPGEPGYGEERVRENNAVKVDYLDKEIGMFERSVTGIHVYGQHLRNPMLILRVNKKRNPYVAKRLAEKVFVKIHLKPFKIFVVVDEKCKDIKDGHHLAWRVFNNTDSQRDFFIEGDRMLIDATYKIPEEGFLRVWPDDLVMSEEVVQKINNEFAEVVL